MSGINLSYLYRLSYYDKSERTLSSPASMLFLSRPLWPSPTPITTSLSRN